MDTAPSSTLRQPPSAIPDCPTSKNREKKMPAAKIIVAGTDCSSPLEATTAPTTPTSSGDESQAAAETMPRPSQLTKPIPFKRPEIDLSAMLNLEQLKQLQVLIGAIMDELQMQVRDTFDKMTIAPVGPTEGIVTPKVVVLSVPNPASEKYRSQYGDIGIPPEKPDFEDYDLLLQIMKAHSVSQKNVKNKAALTIPKSQDDATDSSRRTEVELAVASLTELKRDALGHFGKWRGLVYKRLQEIVIKNGGTGGNVVRQGPHHSSGNARRAGGVVRGSTAARLPGPILTGEASNAQHVQLYPPMYTALCNLPKEKRALILHAMLLMLLGLDQYPTYSRITLIKLATAIEVPTFVLLQDEHRVSQALAQIIKGISAEEVAQRRAEEGKPSKRWRTNGNHNPGASSFSDVLAEPLAGAGLGTVFGGVGLTTSITATLLGGIGTADSTVPVGTLFGLYGARQGGKTMDAYGKDIQDFGLIPMHGSCESEFLDPKDVPAENRRMRVTIGISGWTTEENDFRYPWKVFGQMNEVYALRWELEALSKFGGALQTVMNSAAWSTVRKETRRQMPGNFALARSFTQGQQSDGQPLDCRHGERAVSLVGYGLGARVIYACLTSLSEKRAFGVVENVVLFGAPCPSEIRVWTAMKSIVAGRLINVYSRNDYLLGFLYRTCAWQFGIAGLQAIDGVPRVENIDLSDSISNHLHYQYHIGDVLLKLRWEDADLNEINKEQPKKSFVMQQERNFALALAERNGNVIKAPKADRAPKDRNGTKKQNGKWVPKDKSAGKQPNNRSRQTPTQGNQHGIAHVDENSKPRHKQSRTENQRPTRSHRQEN
ncbi:hypothetical protein NPX13_g7037 [Xylaria arbuscula]|uniref:Uncharacterized protein n=1 Tax=Xylaria arbuscula TaxID=114810 RepID=A0A9W8TL61_9PEZI|nr:hypothetical protein NPX13_g7037 [Xylaria arbuscula]